MKNAHSFWREIDYFYVYICIEEKLYEKEKFFFDKTFSAFYDEVAENFTVSKNVLYIKEGEKESCENEIYCNTSSRHWKYWLLENVSEWIALLLQCTIFHAAAVQFYKKNILILGESGCGKSTLTFNLCNNENSSFVSDDEVYFYHDKIYGLAFPMAFRNELRLSTDFSKWKLIGLTDDAVMKNRKLLFFEQRCFCMNEIDYILFPEYMKNNQLEVREIVGAELIEKLIINIKNHNNMRDIFKDVSKVANKAKAYCLRYSSTKEALEAVNRICM